MTFSFLSEKFISIKFVIVMIRTFKRVKRVKWRNIAISQPVKSIIINFLMSMKTYEQCLGKQHKNRKSSKQVKIVSDKVQSCSP